MQPPGTPLHAPVVVQDCGQRCARWAGRALGRRARRPRAALRTGWPLGPTTALLCLVGAGAAAAPPPLLPVRVGSGLDGHDPRAGVSVVLAKGSRCLRVEPGLRRPAAIAWAEFDDELQTTGWTQLRVGTAASAQVQNDVKMYAAGFLEGMLTAVRMSQFYSNFYQPLVRDQDSERAMGNVKRALLQELEYAKRMANFQRGPSGREPRDPYWKQVRYLLAQLWGLRDGYNRAAAGAGARRLGLLDLLLVNSHARLPALLEAYAPAAAARRAAPPAAAAPGAAAPGGAALAQAGAHLLRGARAPADPDAAWERRLSRTGHCSALVRLAPGSADLLAGHSTWDDYGAMTRVFKYYAFGLPGSWAASRAAGFSSYPGCVSSTDSFYLLDTGLVVMDTSLEVLDRGLYDRVPEFPANPRVPDFMHLMAVNRLAKTGLHWTSLFASRSGGANSAQWLVVDYKRFQAGEPLRDNALRILEQVPGLTQQADLSAELRKRGYWASYNRPYFAEVRALSGHTAAERMYGDLYSFWHGPRAQIFARLGPTVGGLPAMRALMDRNAYPDEGVTPNEPGHAVSARMDLAMAELRLPNGGIDAKVTGHDLLRNLQCQAISGPSHDGQPVFRWRDHGRETFHGWPHFGLPDVWNFSWVSMSPGELWSPSANASAY